MFKIDMHTHIYTDANMHTTHIPTHTHILTARGKIRKRGHHLRARSVQHELQTKSYIHVGKQEGLSSLCLDAMPCIVEDKERGGVLEQTQLKTTSEMKTVINSTT